MKTNDIIKKTVYKYVERDEMFTSLDISQDIKRKGKFIRNVTVRNWLKDNFYECVNEANSCNVISNPNIPSKFAHYESKSIKVDRGSKWATLYKPDFKYAYDYITRDQVPLTPVEVARARKNPISSPKSPDIVDLMDSDIDIISRKINSLERIKIPGAIAKRLGWTAGTLIDDDKAKLIKTDRPLPKGLKVSKDLRISIPREVVAIPNPVKVRCDGFVVTFEKA